MASPEEQTRLERSLRDAGVGFTVLIDDVEQRILRHVQRRDTDKHSEPGWIVLYLKADFRFPMCYCNMTICVLYAVKQWYHDENHINIVCVYHKYEFNCPYYRRR